MARKRDEEAPVTNHPTEPVASPVHGMCDGVHDMFEREGADPAVAVENGERDVAVRVSIAEEGSESPPGLVGAQSSQARGTRCRGARSTFPPAPRWRLLRAVAVILSRCPSPPELVR